ncbi:MAG TPA: hypothetical protein VMH61_08950 [Candidatus Acidoferrales bacterium]|nr:hypothetical protein [Candidatus Acidoferrales bacterium]
MTIATDFRMPDLRFVPVEAVFPHERHDNQRTGPLLARIEESGVLANPPIVTQLGDGHRVEPRYVVLDGANRATAARAAHWPHLVVQVVRYEAPAVQLHTWYHALTADAHDVLTRELPALAGLVVKRETRLHARAMLARREALAVVMLSEDEALVLEGGRSLRERNALLNEIVHVYQDRVPYVRVATDSLAQARIENADIDALVVFPRYDPAEVVELAGSGEHLPAGITRHLIQWRALRLNIPIAHCRDATRSQEEKNAWLREWMEQRLQQRHMRFYEEPTVLFDE